MPTRADVWEGLVAQHGLDATPFEKLVAWPVGDFLFHHEADNITPIVKIRQAGFADALDTEARLLQFAVVDEVHAAVGPLMLSARGPCPGAHRVLPARTHRR